MAKKPRIIDHGHCECGTHLGTGPDTDTAPQYCSEDCKAADDVVMHVIVQVEHMGADDALKTLRKAISVIETGWGH